MAGKSSDSSGVSETEYHRLVSFNQVNAQFLRVLHEMDICFAKLRTGFLNGEDCEESRKTLLRLRAEAYTLDKDIDEILNGGK